MKMKIRITNDSFVNNGKVATITVRNDGIPRGERHPIEYSAKIAMGVGDPPLLIQGEIPPQKDDEFLWDLLIKVLSDLNTQERRLLSEDESLS